MCEGSRGTIYDEDGLDGKYSCIGYMESIIHKNIQQNKILYCKWEQAKKFIWLLEGEDLNVVKNAFIL